MNENTKQRITWQLGFVAIAALLLLVIGFYAPAPDHLADDDSTATSAARGGTTSQPR